MKFGEHTETFISIIRALEGRKVTNEDYTQALNLFYVGVPRAIKACYIMQGTERYRAKLKRFLVS